jgi:protein-tyrosine phosphatase
MSDQRFRRIMFVCSGNICRSPLVHRLFERQARARGLDHLIEVESSGTDNYHAGDEADSRMRATAKKHGWSLSHRARQLQPQDLFEYDIIFAMDQGHLRRLQQMQRSGGDCNVILFRAFDPREDAANPGDVPDPYYGGPEGFEHVYEIVERTSDAILDALEHGNLP